MEKYYIWYLYMQTLRDMLNVGVVQKFDIFLKSAAQWYITGKKINQGYILAIHLFIGTLLFKYELTHWGRVTHLCVSKLIIIIWTNAGILLIDLFGTNSSEILIEIYTF